MDIIETIKEQIENNAILLYMKGSPNAPQCGFSQRACKLLRESGVSKFFSVNVLENPEVREGVKAYANWPTIPQLYVNGEFIGGSDIMMEMFQAGELQALVEPYKN